MAAKFFGQFLLERGVIDAQQLLRALELQRASNPMLGEIAQAHGLLDALEDAIGGRRVVAIMCTHTHRDHSPAARPLADRTGAPVIGCALMVHVARGLRPPPGFVHPPALPPPRP